MRVHEMKIREQNMKLQFVRLSLPRVPSDSNQLDWMGEKKLENFGKI